MMNTKIAQQLDISIKTVERACKRLVEVGLPTCLEHIPHLSKPRNMDGEKEAQLVAISCMDSPEGTNRWTLKLLASCFIELGYVENVSPETIRQVLKNAIKSWQCKEWCIPAKENANFVCAMEEILAVYKQEYDEQLLNHSNPKNI